MSTYNSSTNAYMNLANSQANSAYKSTYLQSGGAYNPISTNSTSFTGGNNSIFTNNTTTPIDYSDIQQVSASGDENGCTDGADDGKIGFGETVGNFFKGLVSPITSMFESPGNFIKGAAMIAGGAILCAATGGAAAPLLVAAGVGMGGFQAVKGAIGAANAKTDAEAKQAWQDIGCGTGMVAGSIIGAKSAAKGAESAGVEAFKGASAENWGFLKSTKACISNLGEAGSASIKAFTSGAWKTNLGLVKNANKGNKAEPKAVTEEPKTEPKVAEDIASKQTEGGEIKPAEDNIFSETKNTVHSEEKILELKQRIKDGQITFEDEDAAMKALKSLIDEGYNPDELFKQIKTNEEIHNKLLAHDLKYKKIDSKSGLSGCHCQEFKDQIFSRAKSGNGEFVSIDDVLAEYSVNGANNAPTGQIREILSENGNIFEIQVKARGNRSNTNIVKIKETSPNTIEVIRDGSAQTKTFAPKENIEYILNKLNETGLEGSAGKVLTSQGKFGPSCVVSRDGSYYLIQVDKNKGMVTSCYPITKDAALDKGFILDLIPVIK